jgi:isopenicillin N synthase-like dioxygenase
MKFPPAFPPLSFDKLNWDSGPPSYIPEIDYAKLANEFETLKEVHPGSEKSKLIAVFDNEASGVFYLKNPPIAEQTVQDLVNLTRKFLSSPAEALDPYANAGGGYTGFSPFGYESTEAAVNRGLGITTQKPAGKDQCLKFSWELGNPTNKWPNKALEEASLGFTNNVLMHTQQILKWIVELYPPEEEQLDSLIRVIEKANPVTRHLLYSDVDKDNQSQSKMHQHADISLMTTSYRIPSDNGFNALHYKINDKFQPTPAPRNRESLHAGEPLAAFYQGKNTLNSPVHYVAMTPEQLRGKGSEHTTLVTFVNPENNAKLPSYEKSFFKAYHQENKGGAYSTAVESMTEDFIPKKSNTSKL